MNASVSRKLGGEPLGTTLNKFSEGLRLSAPRETRPEPRPDPSTHVALLSLVVEALCFRGLQTDRCSRQRHNLCDARRSRSPHERALARSCDKPSQSVFRSVRRRWQLDVLDCTSCNSVAVATRLFEHNSRSS